MSRVARFAFIMLLCAGACSRGHANDFRTLQFSHGAPVTEGAPLDCETRNARQLRTLAPKLFAWAMAHGLAQVGGPRNVASFTSAVVSRDASNQAALVMGCWVVTQIVERPVQQQTQVQAKEQGQVQEQSLLLAHAVFRFNDALRGSPLMALTACRRHKNAALPYAQGDIRIVYEVDVLGCNPGAGDELLRPLLALEKETAVFRLRESTGHAGFVADISGS